MKLQTKYHGEIEIKDTEVIEFSTGIPGFINEKKFVILRLEEESPFFILQSVGTPELAFVLAIPFLYFKDYEIELDENTISQLHIEREEDVSVYSILTVKDPFEQTTANLQAPIIINNQSKRGKQIILTNTSYKTKHVLFERMKEEV
ncbi:flagellar assembly protein FliW [Bacillus kexueae]|uniref:flagellar assembly protein FliW n=1 Tax=Aeribacillus kexueae TaxID=2078952 RepID=UPI001FAE92C5|nr:flagellar assembly protein FliW [Bacillus kexueae]